MLSPSMSADDARLETVDDAHRRLMTRRFPFFAALWIGLGAAWDGVLLLSGRLAPLSVIAYVGLLCGLLGVATIVFRRSSSRARVLWGTLALCQLLGMTSAITIARIGGEGEVLAFALFLLCLTSSLLFAWGWLPASLLAVGGVSTWWIASPWLSHFVEPGEFSVGFAFGAIVSVGIAEISLRSFRGNWERRQSEERMVQDLRCSHEAYRDLAESASDLIYRHDFAGRLTYVNASFGRFFAMRPAELIGRSVEEFLDKRLSNLDVPATIARLARGEAVPPLTFAVKTPEGARWLECVASPISQAGGAPIGIRGIARDVTERKRAEEMQSERTRIVGLAADVGIALTEPQELRASLQRCAEAMVRHLDAAFARIWTADGEEKILELQASAGMYTHIDGGHSRIPVGSLKIGLIAVERVPHLTNQVVGDARIHDQAWARREGMVAFAGYPLVLNERLIGVMALFARHALPESTLAALAAVARAIALGIERMRAEDALRSSYEQLRRREEQLEQLARRQSLIREEERKRLGVDLHDGVCQEIVGIGIHMELLRRDLGSLQPAIADRFARVAGCVDAVIEHLRLLAHDLRPMVLLDLGIEQSLRSLARGMSTPATRIDAEVAASVPPLEEEIALAVYRIAQEALANALRHAGAKRVVLSLVERDGELELEVRDDGCGFVRNDHRPTESIGLLSMEERTHAIRGRLEILSAPGKGTVVRLTFPLDGTTRASAA